MPNLIQFTSLCLAKKLKEQNLCIKSFKQISMQIILIKRLQMLKNIPSFQCNFKQFIISNMDLSVNYGKITGVVCIIGFGSIGKGVLPLIKRHFTYDELVIIDPKEDGPQDPDIKFIKVALTQQNFKRILIDDVFGQKGGFCVNLSVGTSSRQIGHLCQSKNILYIDTVVQQWQGFYSSQKLPLDQRSNFALRERLYKTYQQNKYQSTAISCCGANPGMVSWFVKQALLNIASDTGFKLQKNPQTQDEWARLMMDLGVKGVHIAQRDTQMPKQIRPHKQFWNTWSVDGFISEGMYQPSQLGWGTHEKWKPTTMYKFEKVQYSLRYMRQPGTNIKVKTWCPTLGPQFGFLVTHNEALSICDYFSVKEHGKLIYSPTVHYAYHPCEDAVSSVMQCLGSGQVPPEDKWKIINQQIVDGMDQLGVLLYGHEKNAYWYGSQLSIHDTRKRVDSQNATGLQVTSAVLAGMVWALENPKAGLVQTEHMDFKRCLQVQTPYIAPVKGYYTDWNPLKNQMNTHIEDPFDETDPWQFKNIIIDRWTK